MPLRTTVDMENSTKFKLVERPCSVCDSSNRKHIGWRGGAAHHGGQGERVEIVRCADCTHIYPHPMPIPSEDLEALYTDADEYFKAHDVEVKKRHSSEMLKIIERKLGYKGKLLDVGCGRGELMWAAREAGWEFEGVDPSAAYLDWGRVNLGVEGHLGTLEEMSFREEGFDAILLGGVIEHLYDPYGTLREVWRLLRPGGVFYMDAPNEDGLYTRIGNLYMRLLGRDWAVNLAPTFPPYHVQGFNPNSLRRLVKRAGFDVVQLDIFGEVVPLTGAPTLRKKIENRAARFVNWIGNRTGAGIYMYVWLRKKPR